MRHVVGDKHRTCNSFLLPYFQPLQELCEASYSLSDGKAAIAAVVSMHTMDVSAKPLSSAPIPDPTPQASQQRGMLTGQS